MKIRITPKARAHYYTDDDDEIEVDDVSEFSGAAVRIWNEQDVGGFCDFNFVLSMEAEKWNGNFSIVVEMAHTDLPHVELERVNKVRRWIQGQLSDGWGESFEQFPLIDKNWNEVYVSYWKAGDNLPPYEII